MHDASVCRRSEMLQLPTAVAAGFDEDELLAHGSPA
jgi:hypothetical protein